MKEEILIDINVQEDTGDFAKLSKLKNSIIDIKDEQAKLQKAFKSQNITQKEYATEVVRLEAIQKKLNAAYTETQRKVTGLKSPFESLASSIKEHTSGVSVAGISLASFATPLAATVGLLTALGKAYASSTIGAKDLEFATNQISSATGLLANDLASLISSKEDGEGFFSTITSGILFQLNPALAMASRGLAMVNEELQDLQRNEVKVRGENSDRLEDNAELLTQINQGQKSLNEKAVLYDQVIENLKTNQAEIVKVKQKELDRVTDIFKADSANEEKERIMLEAQKDLNRESARAERLIQAQIRAKDNLYDAERKAAELKATADYQAEISLRNQITLQKRLVEIAQQNFANATKEQMGAVKKGLNEGVKSTMSNLANSQVTSDKDLKSGKEMRVESAKQEATEIAQIQQSVFQQSSQAMQQYLANSQDKAMGLLKGFIASTIRAFKVQIEFMILGQELASKGIFGAITAALEIGVVELAFAAAEQALTSFSGGGYTGPGGKYQPAGVVHKGEVVWSQADVNAMGGPEVVDRMRPTYKQYWDGGVVGGIMQNERNQVAMNNSIRSIQPVLVIEQVEGLLNQRVVIRQRAGQ